MHLQLACTPWVQALLLIDASYGLEMEVMEFLEMCRTHGMPKIIGVLTHLDQMKNSKLLKKTKKQMKHRIWTELYQAHTTHSAYLTCFL